MAVKAVLWDLDGTLLDTLSDLAGSANAALEKHGMPKRSTEEIRAFVGNGVAKLIERAVPAGTPQEETQRVLASFVSHYAEHSSDTTKPYPGVMELLHALEARGVKMGVVSNKIDFAVKALSAQYFGGVMQVAVGDDPARRKKPAPDSVLEAMRQLGVSREETVYVGDSEVDVETAKNAGVTCCAVKWGFRSEECLRAAGAQHIAADAAALLNMLENL